jgi:putative ABC transport system substrate-binding protein
VSLSRRTLIGRLGRLTVAAIGMTALPRCAAATAPASKIRRIGWLSHRDPGTISLHQTLPQLGWVEGRDFAIEVRHADEVLERLPALAAELVSLPVDVLVAVSAEPARAAKQATTSIPIVFTAIQNPIKAGIVADLARPGGNLTGQGGGEEQAVKRLELLKDAVPGLARVAVLMNLTADQTIQFEAMRAAAPALGVSLEPVHLFVASELAGALETVARLHADGLVDLHAPGFFGPGMNSGIASASFNKLLDFAVTRRLPHTGFQDTARAGGLMGFGLNTDVRSRTLARIVDKILRGANPGDLPVEMGAEFIFVVNLSMARKLGLTIPIEVLRQATEVIP